MDWIGVLFLAVLFGGYWLISDWYERRWPADDWHPCCMCSRMVFAPEVNASVDETGEAFYSAVCRRCQKKKGMV